ncbi:hypothetical protein NVP2275O_328 [Vibrio phage 2.275.O._10N.286.54.E11]|nr:hypothetical protein NVP2275O_328 [Vibrio phage 2.275.O._10N.286.54.E11]
MQIIKKTKDFIVVKNSNGSYQTIPNNEVVEFAEQLYTVNNLKPGVVDGRRGECLTDVPGTFAIWSNEDGTELEMDYYCHTGQSEHFLVHKFEAKSLREARKIYNQWLEDGNALAIQEVRDD